MSHRPVIAVRQEPELSIVVCSLGGPGLEKTAESLHASAQASGRPYEIIAVWQTDAAPPELGDDVRVVEIFPVGLSHARNRGLAVARAPVVGFVDDDELVDPGWASAALAAFAAVPRPAAAFGPVAPLDNRGLPYCHLEPGEPRVFFGPATPPWIVGTGGNMAFDREELIAVGGFDPLLGAGAEGQAGEETDVIMRLLRQAEADRLGSGARRLSPDEGRVGAPRDPVPVRVRHGPGDAQAPRGSAPRGVSPRDPRLAPDGAARGRRAPPP